MRIDELDYDLPPELIAQVPAERREDARLLLVDRAAEGFGHRSVADLPSLLRDGDLLVLNDTRVIPARIFAQRETGGRVEIFLLERVFEGLWNALVRARGSLREGEILALSRGETIRLVRDAGEGHWDIEAVDADLRDLLDEHGHMPLPPYIRREAGDAHAALDRERYQTTFAKEEGAVAAPTAGLHLTPGIFEALRDAGVRSAALTLHVGLGTFAPVRTETLADHPMHEEAFAIPEATAEAVRETKARGGRVVAVGTTSVRALEAAAALSENGRPGAVRTRTRLLIEPGFPFRVVDALLTNFHLPRSTLIALVAALAGRERIFDAYREAVAERYRFYSYGDAMLIQ